MIFIVVMN